MRRWIAALGFLAAMAAAAAPARAQSCGSEIYRVARQYGLLEAVAAAAPATPTRPPADSLGETLSRSDGVIAPSEQDRAIALDRPINSDRKALASPVAGDPWRGRLREPTPAARALMSALLLGARAAAEQGSDAICFERLQAALDIPSLGLR
ncbi:MAG TPA: hypothetical protein VLX85_09600 [Stellaceae bacterium]|nr:hypothetical protein [Stellaceae bacterium]